MWVNGYLLTAGLRTPRYVEVGSSDVWIALLQGVLLQGGQRDGMVVVGRYPDGD